MSIRERIFYMIEVARPKDVLSVFYDKTMLIMIVLSIVPLCFKTSNSLFVFLDKSTAVIFITDYILRWITADYKLKKKKITSFFLYPFTFFAVIDLLSILPVFFSVHAGFKILRLMRMNKALRVLKILRYSSSFNLILSVLRKQREPLLAVCSLALGYVLLSALVMFCVEPNSFNSFFDAFYWAMVTLTTVGYGDIYPKSSIGRVVSMISSFVGLAIVALPTGIITAGYMTELSRNGNKNEEDRTENK